MLKTKQSLPQIRDPFQSLMGHFFGDALGDLYAASTPSDHTPRTNISETDQAYELAFELPGFEESDLHVELHDHTLTVTAERRDDRADDDDGDESGRRWHRVEHRYGAHTRAVAMPKDAADDGVEAVYKAGVLTVTVPKQAAAKPARIEVRGA